MASSPAETSGSDERLLDGFWKHGRYYGSWKREKYIFPIDSEELNRLDVFHKFFLVARQGASFTYEMKSENRPRILDLGTGTGIWAINVTENIPGSEVLAVDLNQIQPHLIPRGMTTKQFDIEEPSWESLLWDCDLIHLRLLLGSIRTDLWPSVYKQVYEHLIPGVGHIEQIEIDWSPEWDVGDIPNPSAIKEWSDKFLTGMDKCDRTARVDADRTQRLLKEAGFTDIKQKTIRCYVNPWSEEKQDRETARWFNLGFSQGIEAMSLMPMIDYGTMKLSEVQDLCSRTKAEMCTLRYHAYMTMYIWTAQRPLSRPSTSSASSTSSKDKED